MLNIVLALLLKKKVITAGEAKYLSEELALAIHPTRLNEAERLVTDLLEDYRKSQ